MKVRGKVTPKLRARVLALRAEGLSYRKIEAILEGEGTPLSVQGCCDVVKASGADPGEGKAPTPKPRAPRTTKPKSAPPASTPKLAPPPPPVADELETDLPELPPDAPVAARVLYQDLREVRAVARRLHPEVLTGDYPATQWGSLKATIVRLTRELHAMLPQPKPDPAHDPHNTGARDALVERLRGVVEAAELRAGRLCRRCGDVVGTGA